MGEHSWVGDDAPDHAPPAVVEAKVWASTLVTLAASVGVALLNAVQDQPTLLGGLPPWLQTLLLALVPPLLAFVAGYAKRSNRV
ncbi:hypothetical protein [Pseudonocardia asaccharolytica]|uniref:Holin n=1 Tax=Pseudonocardia asaccharolytica DSM 44247 = NBRC 16224 TaxID=1123024 RepID=A0A511D2B3_9PSEU|nr:hypothetical protein [Pseudonocardia asaccharolytica]GEL17704.1 hypothetical protein PA7_15410 [Pseudonocardia asaccharolytica DSM 44247 = NBRC 16224]